ncbi:hypothetical protein CYMTET_31367 [Cymbomonas tetramitiformis]|uniref:RING-type domain-containing protein n=1 Tax=Cymbomonas tetramitiformis TaxID=36881 RepID=A0AAE0KTA4_9CHLO|nr:hypothetical protein CYMTET_31367 [Cymbomonas tetramitiformis]
MDVLQSWAREHGCPWDASACAAAAGGGPLEALQSAREPGCPWDANTCHYAMEGYMAPELASTGPTTATDMYAYGMTFAAVAPPDGQREAELRELLRGLTAEDPGMRPSAAEACQHPYFAGVWEWQRTQMRVCCVKVELSTCGGAEHSLSDGVECSNRGGPAHFVCGRCLAAHARRESEGRESRVRCPCAPGASMHTNEQDPTVAECESCDYTDMELAQHLRPAEFELYMSGRKRCLQEAMLQEVQASQVEVLREEMEQLRRCKICYTAEANAVFMDCGHFGACLDCAHRARSRGCPFCRLPVRQIQQVFTS